MLHALRRLGLLEFQLRFLDFHLLQFSFMFHLPNAQLLVSLELAFPHFFREVMPTIKMTITNAPSGMKMGLVKTLSMQNLRASYLWCAVSQFSFSFREGVIRRWCEQQSPS